MWVTKYRRRILNSGVVDYLRKLFPKLIRCIPGVEIVKIDFSATDILNKAQEYGFENLITAQDNKISLPNDAKEVIKILCFLDEKLYKSVFSELVIMTNSMKIAD